jgi:coenzyme F420-dependent glucose-6-phosphate dehydrogenase
MQIVFGKHSPKKYLEYASLAESNGFDALWVGDHFHPWAHTGFSGGFAWAWIASAAERTKRIKIGTGVTAPILRYNPAIVAQAFSALGSMYEGRIFLGLGTGEAMNEIPVGAGWPPIKERVQRLEEAVKIIRLLWEGEFVSYEGRYFSVRNANLYTKAAEPIPIIIACHGPKVARIAGKYADGFITSPLAADHFKQVVFPSFNNGAKEAGKNPSALQRVMSVITSYDEDFDKALASARRFAATLVESSFTSTVADPRELEKYDSLVKEEDMMKSWIVSSDIDEHIKKIQSYLKMGFNQVDLASLSPDDSKFIRAYGTEVLPYIKESSRND